MKLIVATGNEEKMKEFRMIAEGTAFEPVSMKEMGIFADPDETGETYEENAMIKAKAVAADPKAAGCFVVADDSGFEVDYLGGEPGVHSARFMGRDTSYDIKNQAIIDKLSGVEQDARSCRFVSAIALIYPDGREQIVRRTLEGTVAYKAAGTNGFGYDPICYVPEFGCTSGEMPRETKNSISHRGKALTELFRILSEYSEEIN